MKNKVIVLIIMILMMCGCSREDYNEKRVSENIYNELYSTYDTETCVEYLEYSGLKKGGLSVRYNTDGTIKLNKDCLEAKDER